MAPPRTRRKGNVLVDVETGEPVATAAPEPFTPAFQSIPGQTPPTQPATRTTSQAQPAQEDLSAISGVPLATNRINKFFLPQGEVDRETFRRALEEARITTQGGRAAPGVQGLLPSTREDLLKVPRETLTPELQRELAGIEGQAQIDTGELAVSGGPGLLTGDVGKARAEFAAQTALAATAFLGISALLKGTLARTAGSRALLTKIGLGGALAFPVFTQRGKISEAKVLTDNSKSSIDDYINEFKAGRMTYTDTIQMIRTETNNIRRNQRTIKTLNQALGNFITGGFQEEADIEEYLRHFNTTVLPDLIASAQRQVVGAV